MSDPVCSATSFVTTNVELNRIVCAALKLGNGKIVLGVRHYDALMNSNIMDKGVDVGPVGDVVQGFVDKFGVFQDRFSAWKIAFEAHQILRRVPGDDINGGKLYSENLY